MKKLSKKQIKKIAAIHSALILRNTDFMFDDICNVTNEEEILILEEIKSIAYKLSKGDIINFGSTESIIKYVREKY